MLERLPALANDDAWLVQRGRFVDTRFLLEAGATQWLVAIHAGRVESVTRGPFVMPRWTFALRAPEEAWRRFWSALPPPGFNDLLAMVKSRTLAIEGDQHVLMANLLYFKDLLALPRGSVR
ncbi:MAG: hypothetical protein JNM90_18125 [Burkholderiales bacterium]|nr:hypothetical protein [Burkholderiales bacterium]